MPAPSPHLAVVMPVFNEEAVLPQTFARLTALFDAQPQCRWLAMLVNDGSRDRSGELLRAQAARDPRFQTVELTRNFGFQAALAAGLAEASQADAVVTMDADNSHDPKYIEDMVRVLNEGASDLVICSRFVKGSIGFFRRARAAWSEGNYSSGLRAFSE